MSSASKIIGFRSDPALHETIRQSAADAGVTVSEWIRLAALKALESDTALVDLGYLQARRTASHLAMQIIMRAASALPENYQAYLEQGGEPIDE